MEYYLIDYENVNTRGLDGITRLSPEDVVIIFYSENADTMTFGLHRRLNESRATIQYQRVEVGAKNALDFQLCSYLGYLIRENEGKPAVFRIVSKDQGYAILATYWKRQHKEVALIGGISGSRQIEQTRQVEQTRQAEQSQQAQQSQQNQQSQQSQPQPAQAAPQPAQAAPQPAQAAPQQPKPPASEKQEETAPEPGPGEDAPAPAEPAAEAPAAEGGALEETLSAMLPPAADPAVVARMIGHYKTKQGINNALMKQYPSQNNKLAAEIYNAIKPLIADKKGR